MHKLKKKDLSVNSIDTDKIIRRELVKLVRTGWKKSMKPSNTLQTERDSAYVVYMMV